jgi:hypothetical protein
LFDLIVFGFVIRQHTMMEACGKVQLLTWGTGGKEEGAGSNTPFKSMPTNNPTPFL